MDTFTGQARKGVYDIAGLYYCAGLISGKNKYDIKFDTRVNGQNKITIIDLVTISNLIRYNVLGEDTISSGGTNFVPKSCCASKPSTSCFADAEILQIKLTEPSPEGLSDMYVAIGYYSSESVAGILCKRCWRGPVSTPLHPRGGAPWRESPSSSRRLQMLRKIIFPWKEAIP